MRVFSGGAAHVVGNITANYNTTNGVAVQFGGVLHTTGTIDGSNCTNGMNLIGGEWHFQGNSTFSSNSAYGVKCAGGARVVRTSGTLTCNSNTKAGVYAEGMSALDIRSCAIGGNGTANGIGIDITQQSRVVASAGTITYNTGVGVRINSTGGHFVGTGANINNNNSAGDQFSPNTEDAESLLTTGWAYIYTL
jgi:hypothetical protein